MPRLSSTPARSAVARPCAPRRCPAVPRSPATGPAASRSSSPGLVCTQAMLTPADTISNCAAARGSAATGNQLSSSHSPATQAARNAAPIRHSGVAYRTAMS